MAFLVQKRVGDDGDWVYWDEQVSLEMAVETVKGYALGDECAFRVVETIGADLLVAFTWGPLKFVVPE